jgi:hypothetical protein
MGESTRDRLMAAIERRLQQRSRVVAGVDNQVMLAACELNAAQKAQPEWCWYQNDRCLTSLGRWARGPDQAPYIRADLVLELMMEMQDAALCLAAELLQHARLQEAMK